MALFATADEKHRAFDGAIARRDFPIFRQKMNGKPLVFLDTAASAQKPQAVLDALQNALSEHYANVHRGVYQFSQKTTQEFEDARAKVANFIGARENEIVFTRNGTEAINLVAASWGRANLQPGDEIIITALEHHANIVPWQLIASQTGVKLVVAPITAKGDVLAQDVLNCITPRTKMLAISHMSNALGTILPVMELILDVAKREGITTLLDGCQAIMHIPVDVKKLNCDFYVFSGHKLYGPTGVGILYGREHILNAMPPYQGGGDMIDRVSFDGTTFKPAPARFEAGTPAIAEVIALGAAINYLQHWGIAHIARYEEEIYRYALTALAAIDGLHLHGQAMRRASILSFTMDWAHAGDVAAILDKEGICVRVGHHCCMPLMQVLGVTATLRASLGLYSTREDIDALVAGFGQSKKDAGMNEHIKTLDQVNAELAAAMIPPFTELSNDPRVAEIVENLRHVYDPEIPVNIYELGLIYEITHDADGAFYIKMTLTAPNCPVAGEMPLWVEEAARKVPGVEKVTIDLTFDPPWTPNNMAETAKLMMNMF